jgi:phosphotransferase system enzyme I (PtsI)
MEIKKGIAVSPGVVIANAVVLDSGEYRIPDRTVPVEQVDAELEKLRLAFENSVAELNSLREATAEQLGRDIASIFDFHYGVLTQGRLREQIASSISKQKYSAAFAVREALRGYQRRFLKMQDQLLRERYKDVRDIERRLLRHLVGQQKEDLAQLSEPSVLIAHDLTPSQSANLAKTNVIGVAMDAGGLTSHTAIVVRSMGIPAVMGLQSISQSVTTGDTIILDGTKGLVIVSPDPEMLAEYRAEAKRIAAMVSGLIELRDKPAVTQDGVQVNLLTNIEFPYEVQTCIEKGSEGIGLYRTEFLYLKSEEEPTEEEHYQAYSQVIRSIGGKSVIIRTLDLGADKYTQSQARDPERNPFLGLRSIRYCLQNLQPFKVQLRAILRSSVEGDVRIMFPLISSLMELRQAKMALGDAMEDLEEMNIPFRRDLPVGIMVETPAAAIQIKELLRESDFISIGTNDLIQYTLAVDRGNEKVATLYTASHPAVLRMLRDIIREANRANVPCSLCGEMAGEPTYTLFLLGIGLRQFSMAPNDVPEIKKIIRSTTMARAVRIAKRALSFDTDRQVSNYLRDETRRVAPEAL